MAVTAAQLQQLYLAYFGRPADFDGIAYYTTGNWTIWQVAQAFGQSPESQALYGTGFNAGVINSIYNNLFNRDAEPAGLLYWSQQVASGALTAGEAALGILLGAQNADLVTVNNKLAVSAQFTAHLDTAAEILAYTGNNAAASARTFLHTVTSDTATVTNAVAAIDTTIANIQNVGGVGTVVSLTPTIDAIVGTSGNDTITGTIGDPNLNDTFTGLDSINGGAGNDVLVINDLKVGGGSTLPGGISVSNVETIKLQSVGALTADVSTYSAANIQTGTVGGAIDLTASGTQVVTASDSVKGANVKITGGAAQNVTTAGGATLSGSKGGISVTDTTGTGATTIDGGTNVAYVSTYTGKTGAVSGTLDIGTTTAPTGTIVVTESIEATGAGKTETGGAINIKGGTTVTVNVNATATVTGKAGAEPTVAQGAVTVTGGTATTTVTVNETAAVTARAQVDAVAGKHTVSVIQFADLKAGQTVSVGDVTYTAGASGATAKQVAAAFSGLSSLALNGYTSGAVSGTGADTVTFESTKNTATAPVVGGTGTITKETDTAGNAATAAVAGRGGITLGVVTIKDGTGAAADTITTATVNNYAAGSSVTSDALTSLTLGGKSGDMSVANTVATSLDLTLNKLTGAANTVNLGGTYTAVKIHTATGDSTLAALTAAGATTLTVDGTNHVTINDVSTMTKLKTVTVTGAAAIDANFSGLGASLTDIDASGSAGSNNVVINATTTKFEGGSGDDSVEISAAPTKAISGGAGNDTLFLNVAAATFSNPSANTNISGFETLGVMGAAVGSYDATGFSHLTVDAVAGDVKFVNVAAGTDLTFTAAPGFNTDYVLKDATGKSDSVQINLEGVGATDVKTVTAAGIESIHIDATDNDPLGLGGGSTADTMKLVATAATSITVTGDTTLSLDVTGDTKLASIDASAMTGGINVTAAGGVASTIKGGAASNALTASAGTLADTLIGGASNDVLTANAGLDTLTGGGGNDSFVIQTKTANVNTYATITDADSGDLIRLVDQGTETFGATKVTLASTAVFQDYANAVVAAGGDASLNAYVGWFVYGGDTYIVESLHNGAATPSFVNGGDIVVKIVGVHDLSLLTDISTAGTEAGDPLAIVR